MILNIFNRKLKRHCFDGSVLFIHGNRGSGKSTVMALICEQALKQGRKVYCQYPYEGAYIIPSVVSEDKMGIKRLDIDKQWLYSNLFEPGSVIMIDEASTVWPARDFKKWSQSDSDFFNFVRKYDILLVIASQYYDQLDLNVKRSADESWFLSESLYFSNFTTIEASKTLTVKVADNDTEILGKAFKRGARKVTYDVCEIPLSNYHFYRKSYYGKFVTNYVPLQKQPLEESLWSDELQFNI